MDRLDDGELRQEHWFRRRTLFDRSLNDFELDESVTGIVVLRARLRTDDDSDAAQLLAKFNSDREHGSMRCSPTPLYCDGWIPGDIGIDLPGGVEAIKAEAAKQGRAFDRLDLTVMTAEEMVRGRLEARISELVKIGFKRISFLVSPDQPDRQRTVLDRYAALIHKFA